MLNADPSKDTVALSRPMFERIEDQSKAVAEAERRLTTKKNEHARNGLVDAAPARRHVRALSRKGMGYKSVARAACVSVTVMAKIRSGKRKQIRAASSKRILAVTLTLAPGAYVNATDTWERINRLIGDGWPKARIAKFLGMRTGALQIGKGKVTRRNELRIARLYRWLNAESRIEKIA